MFSITPITLPLREMGRVRSLKSSILSTFFRPQHSNKFVIQEKKMRPSKVVCSVGHYDSVLATLIGGALFYSTYPLIFPSRRKENLKKDEDEENDDVFSMSEIRHGVMTIVGFIPIFNWMAWALAYLDTKESKYLVFSLLYLSPYLDSGLSLWPSNSWLPIFSVVACGVHVQIDKFSEDFEPVIPSFKGSGPSENIKLLVEKLSNYLPKKENEKSSKDKETEVLLQIWDERLKERAREIKSNVEEKDKIEELIEGEEKPK